MYTSRPIYLSTYLSFNPPLYQSIYPLIYLPTDKGAPPHHPHPNGLESYVPEMPQCSAAFCAATSESERPTRVTVGVMTRGVIHPIRRPINPGTNEKIGCSN